MPITTKILPRVAVNKLIEDYFKSLNAVTDTCNSNISQLENNIFIYNADLETVKRWEVFMGLEEKENYTLRDRQDRIVYTLTNKSIFTKQFLKQQARIFTNGEIDIEEVFNKYHFKIKFTSIVGKVPNIENFKAMVDVSKPAHLTYELIYRYNAHKELTRHNLTHANLKRFTHQQIYDTRIFND